MAVTAPERVRIEVRPITGADMQSVGAFLQTHLNEAVAAEAWARAVDVPWSGERPNAGFMLMEGDRIVGAHLAFYSQRTIAGHTERFCNLGAWCVLDGYRFHALRLLKALLAQDGLPLHGPVPERERRRAQHPARVPVPGHDDRADAERPLALIAGAREGHVGPRRDRADAQRPRAARSTAITQAPPPRGMSC